MSKEDCSIDSLPKSQLCDCCQKNQQALYEAIENLFLITKAQSEHVEHDIDHGRSEIRKCTLINDLTFLDERK